MVTEQWICPYCQTVANYYVLSEIVETIDDKLSRHREWCKTSTPEERRTWMEQAKQEPGIIKYTFPA